MCYYCACLYCACIVCMCGLYTHTCIICACVCLVHACCMCTRVVTHTFALMPSVCVCGHMLVCVSCICAHACLPTCSLGALHVRASNMHVHTNTHVCCASAHVSGKQKSQQCLWLRPQQLFRCLTLGISPPSSAPHVSPEFYLGQAVLPGLSLAGMLRSAHSPGPSRRPSSG